MQDWFALHPDAVVVGGFAVVFATFWLFAFATGKLLFGATFTRLLVVRRRDSPALFWVLMLLYALFIANVASIAISDLLAA